MVFSTGYHQTGTGQGVGRFEKENLIETSYLRSNTPIRIELYCWSLKICIV